MNRHDARVFVRELLDELGVSDWRPAVDRLVKEADADHDLAVAFVELMAPAWLRAEWSLQRSRVPGLSPEDDDEGEVSPSVNPPRLASAAPLYQRLLSQRELGASGWVRLGEMTETDLRAAAARRVHMAEANAAKASKYAALADAVAECGAACVADLPPDVVLESMT